LDFVVGLPLEQVGWVRCRWCVLVWSVFLSVLNALALQELRGTRGHHARWVPKKSEGGLPGTALALVVIVLLPVSISSAVHPGPAGTPGSLT
jgi:hypothetical protein